MTATSERSKLNELRAKTDRDLALLIENALENALLLADVEPDVDAAGILHRRAEDIYADISMLVTLIENSRERLRLEERLSKLGDALDREVRMQTAGVSA